MAIVELQPNNRVMLCSNVPFDSTYTHTMDFGSKASQLAYFQSKAVQTWENLSPIKDYDKIRLPLPATTVYNCNYICYQNTNFGNKWFYCFIKDIALVNPGVTWVNVQMDVFQTWMFDYEVGPSYVVREHPLTDNLGEHTLLEPIAASEFVDEAAMKTGHLTDYDAVIMYAKDSSPGDGNVGGTFTGLTYMHAPLSGSGGAMLDLLESLNNEGKASQVVASYIMPSDFYTTEKNAVEYNLTVPKAVETLGDYTPRNKKLLCYPYNMLNVSNSMGQVNTYRYEYFYNLGSAALFRMSCPMGVSPEVVLWPLSYNGKAENFQETMSLSGFPQFAFVIDTYRQWMAQNGNSYAMSQLSSIAGLAFAGVATGGATTGAAALSAGANLVSSGMNLASSMVGLAEKSRMPNHGQGSQGSNAMVAIKAKDFYFYQHHIREDYAASIDDYFDRFGYLTNRLKVPNLTGRPNYNYVELQEPNITGDIPLGDINIIKEAFSRGITIWHNDNVGNFALKNRPKGEGE